MENKSSWTAGRIQNSKHTPPHVEDTHKTEIQKEVVRNCMHM